MPSIISKDEIVKRCHKGIKQAFKNYEKTAGEWLNRAPEYFLTTSVYQALANGTHYVTLEDNRGEVLKDAGGKGVGKKNNGMRLPGKADLVLWTGASKPRALIEVKHNVGGLSKIKEDIDTIVSILDGNSAQDGGTLKYGFVACYVDRCATKTKSPNKRITDKCENIKHEIEKYFSGSKKKFARCEWEMHGPMIAEVGNSDAWASFIISFQLRRAGF